jgi:hypothetical protein
VAVIPLRRFENAEDFGLITRGDDVSLCSPSRAGASQRDATCKIIDDAVVYTRRLTQDELAALVADMGRYPPGFTGLPAGKIPTFYRAVLAMNQFSKAQRVPTLGQLLTVLEAVESRVRDRDDDFWATTVLVNAIVGKPLAPNEQAYVDSVLAPPPPPATESGSPIALAVALGTGGVVVGGPAGGVVGFIVGLIAGSK